MIQFVCVLIDISEPVQKIEDKKKKKILKNCFQARNKIVLYKEERHQSTCTK